MLEPSYTIVGYNGRVNERLAVILLALLTLLSLWFTPWAAINRETGARSALLLLPNRNIDFTGRTDPIEVPGQAAVLIISVTTLLLVVGAGATKQHWRGPLWMIAGVVLMSTTAWGLGLLETAVGKARLVAFAATVQRAIDNPRPNQDLPMLREVLDKTQGRTLAASLAAAREAGLNVRRLPYNGSGFALSAFLTFVTGVASLLFGLKFFPRLARLIDRGLAMAAVPATSILLALVAAAVVVLSLQPTALGRNVELGGPFMALVGRLDTLWYAYQTLFADSLGTLAGFLEALKFATPLIFTGLAVAFGFHAGMFNIGAPGQMVLGAVFSMLVGVYLPGPRLLVLPAAVIAAAVGGGLWGAIPGWLKARFGANEVINTILLNFVAASFMLFILSSSPTFAASAVRIIYLLAVVVVLALVAASIPWLRRQFARAPRPALAVVGVVVLAGVIILGLPRAGDAPVVVNLPFKVPGSEPKSLELSQAARLPQLPALLGIDTKESPGVNVVPINYAALLAPLAALLAFLLLTGVRSLRPWRPRLVVALLAGVATFGLAALFGLHSKATSIPPTKLNVSFLLAILTAILMQYLLWRTKWGYELRAVGVSPKAAEYGGASIARNMVLAMTISGAFAGLTACHYVLGGALEDYALRQSLPTSDGFDGIAVALLGGNAPVGIVLSAFLFGVLKNGGSVLNITFSDLTRDVVSMILALVVLFIAAKGFLPEGVTNPLKRIRRSGASPPGDGGDAMREVRDDMAAAPNPGEGGA